MLVSLLGYWHLPANNGSRKKLVRWNVLKIVSKHGGVNYYALNEDSGFIEAFERLNNRIIEQMLGDAKLAEIANYPAKPAQVCTAPKLSGSGYTTG